MTPLGGNPVFKMVTDKRNAVVNETLRAKHQEKIASLGDAYHGKFVRRELIDETPKS